MAFHWKDGWYFDRLIEDKAGYVHIYHVNPDNERDLSIEIDPHSWASIIASVSPEGETGYTYNLASAFHGILSYMK